jgi:hypothetical protein
MTLGIAGLAKGVRWSQRSWLASVRMRAQERSGFDDDIQLAICARELKPMLVQDAADMAFDGTVRYE